MKFVFGLAIYEVLSPMKNLIVLQIWWEKFHDFARNVLANWCAKLSSSIHWSLMANINHTIKVFLEAKIGQITGRKGNYLYKLY